MKSNRFAKNEEGVSAVMGVILMVAITVIMAAIIATFVLNMANGVQTKKNVAFTLSRNVNGVDVTLHDAGGAQQISDLRISGPSGASWSGTSPAGVGTVVNVGGTWRITFSGTSTSIPQHIVLTAKVDNADQVVADCTI